MGKLYKQLANQQSGQFLANTQTNPKEHCNLITTRSGKVVGKGIGDKLVVEEERKDEEEKSMCEREEEKKKKKEKKKKMENKERSAPIVNVSYPHAPSRRDKERKFTRFQEIFKNFHITIPFAEALEQMPTYEKLVKELLTKERRFI